MKLICEFDWSRLLAKPATFVEMDPGGGRLVITPAKLEQIYSELAPEKGPGRELRDKAYDFMVKMINAGPAPAMIYSPQQITTATNVYLSHSGSNPVMSTARIFQCAEDEILKLEFCATDQHGRYELNRGFVAKSFLESCEKIRDIMASWSRPVEYVLHAHSPGAELLFAEDELTEMFALYVLPVSQYFWGTCFYDPFRVSRAGLA